MLRARCAPTPSIRALLVLLVGSLSVGCGGMVVFDGDGDGAGGSVGSACVLGACGDPCTKCTGDDCFNGGCDAEGECIPPDSPLFCAE